MKFASEIIDIVVHTIDDSNVSLETRLVGNDSQVDSLSIIEILVRVQNFAKENNLIFEWSMDNVIIDGENPLITINDLILNFTSQNNK